MLHAAWRKRYVNSCTALWTLPDTATVINSCWKSIKHASTLQVLNTGRLLKCSQAFAEENETLQKQSVAELAQKVQQLENAATSSESHRLHWEAAQEHALQVRMQTIKRSGLPQAH